MWGLECEALAPAFTSFRYDGEVCGVAGSTKKRWPYFPTVIE